MTTQLISGMSFKLEAAELASDANYVPLSFSRRIEQRTLMSGAPLPYNYIDREWRQNARTRHLPKSIPVDFRESVLGIVH